MNPCCANAMGSWHRAAGRATARQAGGGDHPLEARHRAGMLAISIVDERPRVDLIDCGRRS